MGQITGIITAGLQLGLESVLVRPQRSIGPFEAQVWLEENHVDELEITDSPLEYGAPVTDHAFMRPAEVTITCGWSNSPSAEGGAGGIGGLAGGIVSGLLKTVSGLASILNGADESGVRAIYENMLILQASRIPFDILTGKRAYQNMLIKSLREQTNRDTENSLVLSIVCRQVLIVRTQVVTVGAPKADQKEPGSTQPTQDKGTKAAQPAPTYNAGAGRGSINPTLPP